MEVIVDRCAGLDVHQKTVVAAVRTPGTGRRKRDTQVRTFSTFDDDLVALRRWLFGLGVTQVAMEATGVFWKPVWQVLDDGQPFVRWLPLLLQQHFAGTEEQRPAALSP